MTRNSQTNAPHRRRGGNSRQRGGSPRYQQKKTPSEPPAPKPTFFQKLLSLFGFGTPKSSGANGRPAPARPGPRPAASGSPSEKASRPRRPNPADVTSGRLHVGNLSYDAAESDLFDLFSGIGQVKLAEVVYHRHNHRSKGFAFVEMQTTEEARRAVEELHDKEFMGRKLSVSGARSAGERSEPPRRSSSRPDSREAHSDGAASDESAAADPSERSAS